MNLMVILNLTAILADDPDEKVVKVLIPGTICQLSPFTTQRPRVY